MTPKNGNSTAPTIALNSTLPVNLREVRGVIRRRSGENWYEIHRADEMSPFLMTMASDSNHWLFLSSNGGMTAGRVNPEKALFPYHTQDKLEDMAQSTGSFAHIQIRSGDVEREVWEPFSRASEWNQHIHRTIKKNLLGNHIILEETHTCHNLIMSESWRPSGRFGFVRKVRLSNEGRESLDLTIMDGLVNLMPAGLGQRFVNEFSNLANAYKQGELDPTDGLATYHLSSVPTDLAEPKESLLANVAWQTGMADHVTVITQAQVKAFQETGVVQKERHSRGRPGAYLMATHIHLAPGEHREWYICADVELDAFKVEKLKSLLAKGEKLAGLIEKDCQETEQRLRTMLGTADGLQLTGDDRRTMRHTSNTLFNLMRGGAFPTGYNFPEQDLIKTVQQFNKEATADLEKLLQEAGPLTCSDPWRTDHPLQFGNRNLLRLLREYLPLSFSRRHGDPSRPWNRFSIEIMEADGSPRYYYQGNWRDIFQNWEALLYSYPEYCEATICRFLNATTADGYNPYRLTKDGFDWEVITPDDPWANIGYWGDHQIVYLLRLLEASVRFHPGRLNSLLQEETFVYAEVPYRIRAYEDIVANPRETVDYDTESEKRIRERVDKIGADGKLAHTREGNLVQVTLLEKLLNPLVAKLSNFVPDGGIWMNTQRPEWNDANNALVGSGVSVVTLGYIARYISFLLENLGNNLEEETFAISSELAELIQSQKSVFESAPCDYNPGKRRRVMDELGQAASAYRQKIYDHGLLGESTPVTGSDIRAFLASALEHAKASLRKNRREDALWHSYNLVKLDNGEAVIDHLKVMLEGQVSILSAGLLGMEDVLQLLEALRKSPLYRADQNSYILYPDREMPEFLQKNRIPADKATAIPTVRKMVEAGDTRILVKLPSGDFAFNGNLHNEGNLRKSMDKVFGQGDTSCRKDLLNLFEETFNHHAFTGRSGTFFAYEGLGSIYWHMVSKLALAVLENYLAFRNSCSPEEKERLLQFYREIIDGLGVNKNPAVYGAFPTDAYSHTPAHAGAQQPGMTGQVKEDILIRLAELGVSVQDGCLSFGADMVGDKEFLSAGGTFTLPCCSGQPTQLQLEKNSLAFTLCGTPVVYQVGSKEDGLVVHLTNGESKAVPGLTLPGELSRELFRRNGSINRLEVNFTGPVPNGG